MRMLYTSNWPIALSYVARALAYVARALAFVACVLVLASSLLKIVDMHTIQTRPNAIQIIAVQRTNISMNVLQLSSANSPTTSSTVTSTNSPTTSSTVTSTNSPTTSSTVTSTNSPTTSSIVTSTNSPTTSSIVTSTNSPTTSSIVTSANSPTTSSIVTSANSPTTSSIVTSANSPTTSSIVTSTNSPTTSSTVTSTNSPTTSSIVTSANSPTTSSIVTSTNSPTTSSTVTSTNSPTTSSIVTSTNSPTTSSIVTSTNIPTTSSKVTSANSPTTSSKVTSANSPTTSSIVNSANSPTTSSIVTSANSPTTSSTVTSTNSPTTSSIVTSAISLTKSSTVTSTNSPTTSSIVTSTNSPTTSSIVTSANSPTTSSTVTSAISPTASLKVNSANSPTTSLKVASANSPTTSSIVTSANSPTTSSIVTSANSPTTSSTVTSAISPTTSLKVNSANSPTTSLKVASANSPTTSSIVTSAISPTTSLKVASANSPTTSSTVTSTNSPTTSSKVTSANSPTTSLKVNSANSPTTSLKVASANSPTTSSIVTSAYSPTTSSIVTSTNSPTTSSKVTSANSPTTSLKVNSANSPTTSLKVTSANSLTTSSIVTSANSPTTLLKVTSANSPTTSSTMNSATNTNTPSTVNSFNNLTTSPIPSSKTISAKSPTVNINTLPAKLSTVNSISNTSTTNMAIKSITIPQSPSTANYTISIPLPISTSETKTIEQMTYATPQQVVTNATITTTVNPKGVNISVSLNSSPFTVEQKKGYISCSFQRYSTSNNPITTWSKNGRDISNSSAILIYSSCNGLNCKSNLTLLQMNVLSKGKYKCGVLIKESGVTYKGQAETDVTVKQKPVLVIEPIRSSVTKGSNVSVHCKVANIKDAYLKSDTVIKMCFGNKTELQGCHSNSTYNSTCNIVVESSMTIKCGLSNCSNYSITSTITAVRKADKLCKTDNQWPSTQQGQEARIPCPEGYSGEVTRKCLSNGKWDTTHTSESCTQNRLKEIENVLQNATILTADNVESSLSTISSILVVNNSTSSSNEKKLADNDIKQSVDLISTISKKNVTFTDQEAANKTTQVFMGIVSDILNSTKNTMTSKDTNKKEREKKVTSKILASVNSFAKSVTSALKVNQNVTVKKHNMLLSIEKIDKNTDIKFPKETEDSSQQTTHFVLPQGAFKNMSETEVAFTAVKYENIGSEFISNNYTEVGSSVLSLTVNGLDSQHLEENIILSFQRKNVTGNSTECVFLWGNNSDTHSVWNTSGCSLKNSTDSQVNCSCDHLTNFAILMSYTDGLHEEVSKEDIKRLKIISVFGCSLSIIGAFVTIVLYIYFWRYIKSRRSTLVINLCSALCIAYLLFLTAVEHSENKTGCIIIAALLHYFFLAMFTTMLCLGIDLAVAVFDVFSSRSRSAIFLLVSWGLPAVIVAITLGGSQLEGYGDETYCWLRHTTLFGFIVPVLCIVLVNLIIVIFVMRRIYTSSFMMKKSLKEKTLSGLKGVCGLLPILGLTWVFGIFSVNQDLIIFQYLFAVFNSLQGLFIFLFYVALNPQMREAVARKIKIYDSKSSISKTSKTTKFVSTSYSEEEQHFEEREDGTAASNMFIIPRCSVQNKLFNKRQ
ncbi:uncharacterized protein [Magallana gigas]|uniref:uncharacterized protein n=1 Tax=Magallana gigas TaxID=29159 RepID=UPI0033425EB5